MCFSTKDIHLKIGMGLARIGGDPVVGGHIRRLEDDHYEFITIGKCIAKLDYYLYQQESKKNKKDDLRERKRKRVRGSSEDSRGGEI